MWMVLTMCGISLGITLGSASELNRPYATIEHCGEMEVRAYRNFLRLSPERHRNDSIQLYIV